MMPPDLAPLHDYLTFVSPLDGRRADELVGFVASRAQGTVVDIGCGWAELLLRVLGAGPALLGFGLDLDESGFAKAREQAARRGVADRLSLYGGDAKASLPARVGGAMCLGASQVWGLPVEANEPLDYAAALTALRSLLAPGAPLVYGEGIWSKSPTDAACAPRVALPSQIPCVFSLKGVLTVRCVLAVVLHDSRHEA